MKVKVSVSKSDIENGFSQLDDYSFDNLDKYPELKDNILQGHKNKVENISTENLAIEIYAEDLNLPGYITKDIYSKVEKLISSEFPYMKDYIVDLALIAEYLHRYSRNNLAWPEDFLRELNKHYEEIDKIRSLVRKLDTGIEIKGIFLEIKEVNTQNNVVPEPYELKDTVAMKILLNGLVKELAEYQRQAGFRNKDEVVYIKIQSEYYTPMLKAYFEMIHNEGILVRFNSIRAVKLLFGYLGEIAGAFDYSKRDTGKYRKQQSDKIKPVTDEEIEKLNTKVDKYLKKQKDKNLDPRIESMCETYMEQTGTDIKEKPLMIELSPTCSLRDYIITNNIPAKQILSIDYKSAVASLENNKLLFHKGILDSLLDK